MGSMFRCDQCGLSKDACQCRTFQPEYKIGAQTIDKKIEVSIDFAGQVQRLVLDTAEQMTQERLISLGWTPPGREYLYGREGETDAEFLDRMLTLARDPAACVNGTPMVPLHQETLRRLIGLCSL